MVFLAGVYFGARQQLSDDLGLFGPNPAKIDTVDLGQMPLDERPRQQFKLRREAFGLLPELEVPLVRDFLELHIARNLAGCRVGYGHIRVVTRVQG